MKHQLAHPAVRKPASAECERNIELAQRDVSELDRKGRNTKEVLAVLLCPRKRSAPLSP